MPFARSSGGGTSKWGSSSASKEDTAFDINKLQRQIDNAKLRAVDAGFEENPDKRNWFEKMTNLPQGQNGFLDALELLGRPGQAVLNAIDKAPTGERNVGEAMWRGFAGHDRVRGSEIIENRGVDNPYGKAIGGFALEVVTDPLNLVPAGAVAKVAKTAAAPVGRGFAKAYNAVETALPSVQRFRANTLQPATEKTKDALGRMFVPQYKWDETLSGGSDETLKRLYNDTDNRIKIMNEDALQNVADTAKITGGVETGDMVGRVMESPLRQFTEVKGYEFPDGLRRTENKTEIVDAIVQNRSAIKGLNKEVNQTGREYQKAIGEIAQGLNKTDNEIRRLYTSLERQAGKEIDAATRQNLREAGRELARIDSQLNNFGNNETALLKNFKKQVQDEHQMNFDIIKRVRQTSPDGIKGVNAAELPTSLRNFVRQDGKGIDEVADELGYRYADDLIQDLKQLNGVPRRLDNETAERFARQRMEQSGALKSLFDTKAQLETTKITLQASIKQIGKQAPKLNGAKASENAFSALSQSPRYMELDTQKKTLRSQLDALKGESKEARQARLTEIKRVEQEIESLREAIRNPVMIEKELPRPQRDMPTDPGVTKAAQTLIQSNKMISEWAQQNGVNVSELEGYMTHILSQEERAARTKRLNVDRGNAGPGQPKKAILNQRQLTGSVEDINERMGRKFFEPNAYFATAIGQKRLIEYANAVKFRRDILSNPNFAQKFVKGMDVPENAVVINTNNYKFIKEGIEGVPEVEEIGGEYLVTKGVKEALDRYQSLTTNDGVRSFLKAFDASTGVWKKFTLFSPGYHIRNAIGAMFNNYVGGMNVLDLTKYTTEAAGEVTKAIRGQESKLFREYREQGLGASSLSQVEFRPYNEPEKAITRTIEERSKDLKGQILTRLKPQRSFETSRELGDVIDQSNRFALYKWAREKKGMTAEQATAKVREVQFDYSRTTATEREIMTRMIPFYRWMRNNIPYQIRQFINDPAKYSNVNKIRLNAQDSFGIEEENTPDWMKEQFALPVSEDKFLSLGLPAGDLTKITNPLRLAVDGLTPLVKTPIELATNYNLFYGKPIEKFEGQEKQFSIAGQEFGIPSKTAYALEQMTGQIGRGFSQYLTKPESVDQDTMFRMPKLGINSVVKDYDQEKSAYFEKLNELQQYLDYLKYIEQQTGQKPRTVNEIRR